MRKTQFILFGQDMSYLGTEMIPAYTPEGRGRTEKVFCTHQDRPQKELAAHGINEIDNANRYLDQAYQPTFSTEFLQLSVVRGFAFVLRMEVNLDAILYEKYERTVITDNCVTFEGKTLQIPADKYRCHYVKVKMMIHRYGDGSLAIFHGPRKLADYDKQGKLKETKKKKGSITQRSYPQPSPALLCRSRGRMAVDNSCQRKMVEESEGPPLPSCLKMTLTGRL